MDLAEIALRLQKEKLKELLKEQEQQDALQVLKQGWQSVQPDLRKAYLRLQLRSYLTIVRLLKNHPPKELSKYIAEIFKPPASPEKAKIQLLADIVISLVFPDKKIEPIIWKALSEIKEAYKVIIKRGGGWSLKQTKDDPDKRETAVLEWFRCNQARLSYLKETHLQDKSLYNPGIGQEKRYFIVQLLKKIMKEVANRELTFQKINDFLENLKKINQPLQFKDL